MAPILPKSHRVFHGIDQANAREFLINLLADLLGGSHAYLLPCEAVFELPLQEAFDRVQRRKDEGKRERIVQFPLWSRAQF